MTWIPTSKHLPPNGKEVELMFNEYDDIRTGYYMADWNCWFWMNGHCCKYEPTFWRKKRRNEHKQTTKKAGR